MRAAAAGGGPGDTRAVTSNPIPALVLQLPMDAPFLPRRLPDDGHRLVGRRRGIYPETAEPRTEARWTDRSFRIDALTVPVKGWGGRQRAPPQRAVGGAMDVFASFRSSRAQSRACAVFVSAV